MKKVVRTITVREIAIDSIGEHAIIGAKSSIEKYIAAQVEPSKYMLFGKDNGNGLNRIDGFIHDGTNKLAEYYLSKDYEIYAFSTSNEMLKWFIE